MYMQIYIHTHTHTHTIEAAYSATLYDTLRCCETDCRQTVIPYNTLHTKLAHAIGAACTKCDTLQHPTIHCNALPTHCNKL